MEFIQPILDWFTGSNWMEMAGVAALWLVAFERLAELTSNTWDNKAVAWVKNIFSVLGGKLPTVSK